jgi:hypothetical protein
MWNILYKLMEKEITNSSEWCIDPQAGQTWNVCDQQATPQSADMAQQSYKVALFLDTLADGEAVQSDMITKMEIGSIRGTSHL